MYDLVEARHTAEAPVDLYYYKKALPVIVAAVTEGLDRATADAALAAAVVPNAVALPRPRSGQGQRSDAAYEEATR